ncbi:MAG TPA: hypothetical protein VMX17_01550 [Candidatus Glassbacteria bacterium]|nr:hypothetical protein [Candidatus Glassbacteria bacterium]
MKDLIKKIGKSTVFDLKQKRILNIRLEQENNEIDTDEAVAAVRDFVEKQLKDTDNKLVSNTLPLMSTTMINTLGSVIGSDKIGALLMAQPLFRDTFIREMLFAFYMGKYLAANNINIVPFHEELSEEEVESFIKIQKLNDLMSSAGLYGVGKKEFVKAATELDLLDPEAMKVFGYTDEEIAEFIDMKVDSDSKASN